MHDTLRLYLGVRALPFGVHNQVLRSHGPTVLPATGVDGWKIDT